MKPINQILKAVNKTRRNASLQIVQSECNFGCRVTCTRYECIFKHLKLYRKAEFSNTNNFYVKDFSLKGDYKIYKISILTVARKAKKINTVSCKISDQSKSLVITEEEHWKCQIKLKLNRQPNSEDINIWLRLDRAFLSKYRYTSLELVVRSAAFLADAVAKFRTDNPVRVGSSENNKEHCHYLWQCHTIVDS
ncbi:hypothetical protein [Nostoc sp. T09]|uniref:hypothetical protein n=1 Tax=Nostoc sp. T09 TaxID=1932621 RepID=UPI00211B5567|nr:hypothetical protein [Nostoc sp. T09]